MKAITTERLIEMTRTATRRGYTNRLTNDGLDMLDPDGWHISDVSFLHNDVNVRAVVLMKVKDRDQPWMALLDFDIAEFNALPDSEEIVAAQKAAGEEK